MPAVEITDGPPSCTRDHQAVVLSCSHLARRWVALERRSAWLVDTQVKACCRETHSPSRASKTYGHNVFQIIHIHTTVINSGRAHTTQHHTHYGLWLWLQSWLMPQSPHRLRNDLNCVEWDVRPCSIQSIEMTVMVGTPPLGYVTWFVWLLNSMSGRKYWDIWVKMSIHRLPHPHCASLLFLSVVL